jgi:hypothetical protein
VDSDAPQQQQQQQQQRRRWQSAAAVAAAGGEEPQLSPMNPIAAMGGLAAFRAQLAAHLGAYAASGGAEPRQVLTARQGVARGLHLYTRLEGAVIWYPVRDMTFLRSRQLSFPACVLHGQQQPVSGAAAALHVLVPTAHPAGSEAVQAAGSTQVAGPLLGRLQLPGVWQEAACLEVSVCNWSAGPHLYRAGGWPELQHLADHYMLALSAVSDSPHRPSLQCQTHLAGSHLGLSCASWMDQPDTRWSLSSRLSDFVMAHALA